MTRTGDRSDGKAGLAAALDAIDVGSPPTDGAEQIELLPLSPPIAEEAAAIRGQAPAKRGRPKGSKNRRTEEWQDYLLGRYTSPLEVLAQTITRPVGELAGELDCSALEAFKLQLTAAEKLAPYIHQKMPTAVDLGGAAIAPIVFKADPEMAAAFGVLPDAPTFTIADAEIIENQNVTEASVEQSDDQKSDGES